MDRRRTTVWVVGLLLTAGLVGAQNAARAQDGQSRAPDVVATFAGPAPSFVILGSTLYPGKDPSSAPLVDGPYEGTYEARLIAGARGLSEQAAARQLELTGNMGELSARMEEVAGARYAASWLDYEDFKLVFQLTAGDVPSDVVALAESAPFPVLVQTTTRASDGEVQAFLDSSDDLVMTLATHVMGVGFDVHTEEVVVNRQDATASVRRAEVVDPASGHRFVVRIETSPLAVSD